MSYKDQADELNHGVPLFEKRSWWQRFKEWYFKITKPKKEV